MISKGAKDLIKRMLTLNPRKRISAKEALSDPWVTNNNHTDVLKKNIIENLTNFQVDFQSPRAKADSGMPS